MIINQELYQKKYNYLIYIWINLSVGAKPYIFKTKNIKTYIRSDKNDNTNIRSRI